MLITISVLLLLFLACLALYDYRQTRHAIWRNYPLFGRLRWLAESLRPKIAQYFVESNTDGKPIPRYKRNLVYQRAKGDGDKVAFGTELDLYDKCAEWTEHSMYPPNKLSDAEVLDLTTVRIGGTAVRQYDAKVMNISAMSYGALSHAAVESLNRGASLGGFYHNTGEGGISVHHLHGGDLVWQIGTGYFGCRTPEGLFDIDMFKRRVRSTPQIKMIEIKLSQGAKPAHGGILPGVKNTPEIAEIRGITPWTDVVSPPAHSAFSDSTEMLTFIDRLRQTSGLPVGIKMCVGNRDELVMLFDRMHKMNVTPDFITVDGAEGGTGAAPMEFTNYVGTPLRDGLEFLLALTTQYGFRANRKNPRIAIIVSGGILTGFDIFKYRCLGADVCNVARGFMLSLGCIQAQICGSGNCPTGVATNKIRFSRGLVPEEKYKRAHSFWSATVDAYLDICRATRTCTINGFDKSKIITRR